MKYVVIAVGFFISVFSGYYALCAMQHRGYRLREYLSGIEKLIRYDVTAFLISLLVSLLMSFFVGGEEYMPLSVMLALLPPLGVIVLKACRFQNARYKPTKRARRLAVVYLLLCIGYGIGTGFADSLLRSYGCFCALNLLTVAAATAIMMPFENKNNKGYIALAKSKLQTINPKVIAITGSAGKTSVKEQLRSMLSQNKKVFATPESYNTPLGIARAIQMMPLDTEIFIAEFGARHKGDVEELCKMINPSVGVVTAIVPQHLSTFGSIEEIANEKTFLLRYTDTCYANSSIRKYFTDDGYWTDTKAHDDKKQKLIPDNTVFFGREQLSDASCGLNGINFALYRNGIKTEIVTPLLGEVNLDNLALSVGVALELGCSIAMVTTALKNIKPVPHRMEAIKNTNGVLIIDDSYNINPKGARSSLELLKQAKGRRIVTCSGYVEQGLFRQKALARLCELLCDCADIVIVLGKQNKAELTAGLEGKISFEYAEDIKECKALYERLLKTGDTLLIMSDIPIEYDF